MLFACPSTYKKEVPADILKAHRDWLQDALDKGAVISAGRRDPAIGGMILLRAESRDEALAILAQDPCTAEGVAEYDALGFNPTFGDLKG